MPRKSRNPKTSKISSVELDTAVGPDEPDTLAEMFEPGDDQPVGPGEDLTVLQAVQACKREAEQARRGRMARNKINFDAFLSRQDWSHKQAGQSTEFLPKVSLAVEQAAAFAKRGVVAFGDWFQVDLRQNPFRPSPIGDVEIVRLLRHQLEDVPDVAPDYLDFPTVLSDALKAGLLGSLVILKVYGTNVPVRDIVDEERVEEEETPDGPRLNRTSDTVATERRVWRSRIDLVRQEDYYPDPSGRGLYEIQRIERDLHEVVAMADDGLYDPEAVRQIEQDFIDLEREAILAREANQETATAPSFRKRVNIDEFWGTLLDSKGRVVGQNIVCAVANEKYLIRKPEPNPFWHQSSPFVVAPLVRVPSSVWHKALYDNAVDLNLALNELFNLILDGGVAAVWGIKQIKEGWLKNPAQVSNGVAQGMTLVVKDEVPPEAKVLETVATGDVPKDALATYNLLDREFLAAALSSDLKMGLLPPKQVKATEIVEASQQSAVFFDGMVFDLENRVIRPAIWRTWVNIVQHLPEMDAEDVIDCVGPQAAMQLSQLPPAERFARLARRCRFKVHGLSAVLAKVREFQKLMALLQSVSQNALLMQAFAQRFSTDKILTQLLKTLNINPENLEQSAEEKASQQQRMQQLAFFQNMISGRSGEGGGAGMAAQDVGEVSLPAEVNQATNPMTGLGGV